MSSKYDPLFDELDIEGVRRWRSNQIEKELGSFSTATITFNVDPSGSHLYSMMELRQAYAKRTLDFAEAVKALLLAQLTLPAVTVARSLIETVAMGCHFLSEMERLIGVGNLDNLNNKFERFYAGMVGGRIKPVHVNDALRHLEEIDGVYVTYLDEKYGTFSAKIEELRAEGNVGDGLTPASLVSPMKNYDKLSEVAHPNGTGVQFLYPDASAEDEAVANMRHFYRLQALGSLWHGHHLLTAIRRTYNLPERYREKFPPE